VVEQALGHWEAFKAKAEKAWSLFALRHPRLGAAGRFALEVWRKYMHDDCFSYAAGLSFWLMVSIVPLSTLLFKLLAVILGTKAYGDGTLITLRQIVPYLPDDFLRDIIPNSRKAGGVWFSWIVLLLGSYWGVGQLDTTLAHVFGLRIKKHRQTRKNHLLRQIGFLVGGLLFLVIFLAMMLGGVLRHILPIKQTELMPFLPPLMGLLVVTMVLQHLPRCHVSFKHAFMGAGISTALWWLAKWGFGIYLSHSFTIGIMYGSLVSIVAGLTFLYYSCAIFLLGAEITAAFYRHETGAIMVPKGLRASDVLKDK
jgi:membrane protein